MRKIILIAIIAALALGACREIEAPNTSSIPEPAVSSASSGPPEQTESLAEQEPPAGEPSLTLLDALSRQENEQVERITFHNELDMWEGITSLRLEYPALVEELLTTLSKIEITEPEPAGTAGTLSEYTENQKTLLFQFVVTGRDRVTDLIVLEDGKACFLSDGAVFTAEMPEPGMGLLRSALIKASDLYETTPEYCVRTIVSPSYLNPASTAVFYEVINDGRQEISISGDLALERLENGDWIPLEETEPFSREALVVSPKSTLRHEIPFDRFEDARTEGEYRIRTTLRAAREQYEVIAEYELSKDAEDATFEPPPEMAPENREIYEKYIRPLGNYSVLFAEGFSEGQNLKDFHVLTLFSVCAELDGKWEEYLGGSGMEFPGDIVENTIRKYFNVTDEQIRENMGYQGSQGDRGDQRGYYDPNRNIYNAGFADYHIPVVQGVVTGFSRNGDSLSVEVDWFNRLNAPAFSGMITIRLSENGFRYTGSLVREYSESGMSVV